MVLQNNKVTDLPINEVIPLPQIGIFTFGFEYYLYKDKSLITNIYGWEQFPYVIGFKDIASGKIYSPEETIILTESIVLEVIVSHCDTDYRSLFTLPEEFQDNNFVLENAYFDGKLTQVIPEDRCVYELLDNGNYQIHLNYTYRKSNVKCYLNNEWVDCESYVYQNGAFIKCEIGGTY